MQQRFDAPVGRGMCAEESHHAGNRERLDDEQVRGRGVDIHRNGFRRGVDLLERAHETHHRTMGS